MSKRVVIASIMRPTGETGVQSHFNTFMNWMFKKGLKCSLVTSFSVSRSVYIPIFAVRKVITPLNREWSVWWYRFWHQLVLHWALRRVLYKQDECVIYAQCPLSADAALKARKSPKQKVFLVVHFNKSQADEWVGKGMLSINSWLFNKILDFERSLLPKLDGIIYVSKFMRSEIENRIPDAACVNSQVIPNFVDELNHCKKEHDSSYLAKEIPNLICIGTLEDRKNQSYALDIVHQCKVQGAPVHLSIIGNGVDMPDLLRKAKALDISEYVTFFGHVNNASDLLKDYDACLHVAKIENLPITLIEALSAGLPLFAPAVGGITEVFDDGVEGRYIPLDDARQASKILVEFMKSNDLVKSASLSALETYKQKFETNAVATKLHQFLCSD